MHSRRTLLTGAAAALLPARQVHAAAPSVITVATVGDPGSLDPMPGRASGTLGSPADVWRAEC
jgi:hypothetical protein